MTKTKRKGPRVGYGRTQNHRRCRNCRRADTVTTLTPDGLCDDAQLDACLAGTRGPTGRGAARARREAAR